ncbi:hypothetical protein TARUN_5014 [Trichoderma arundinaceum]|uniref:HNH nuclease domain-containing protein n=1 Tax=Trichoderma arundinaceum TaxID=490622 RepID=A0A395NMX1_TRIAR|nr:hypothetical protein TARUN_5014 [Trichoderma arundinaceum]
MIAPVDQLRSKLATIETSFCNKDFEEVADIFDQWRDTAMAGIQAFANRGQRFGASNPITDNSPASSIRERPAKRQKDNASKLCKQRDAGYCHFTGMPNSEATHIFPIAAAKSLDYILSLLELFWGSDTAARFSALIRHQNITESGQNLLSLNRQLHWWFDNARMALKPLRKIGDNSIEVQLHRLKQGNLRPSSLIPDNQPLYGLLPSGVAENSYCWGGISAHRNSGLQLETGQTFRLRAENPRDVPDFDLLQLSWDLLRVVAICGAAEEQSIEEDDDDDDDYSYDDYGNYNYEDDGNEVNMRMWDEDDYAQLRQW